MKKYASPQRYYYKLHPTESVECRCVRSFYRRAPTWTLSKGAASGYKIDKMRLIFLVCCNSDGLDRIPFMVIDNVCNPRPINGNTASESGIDYHVNKKDWMAKLLFFDWLLCFDCYVGLSFGRKVLLLLYYHFAHGTKYEFPSLQNVRV